MNKPKHPSLFFAFMTCLCLLSFAGLAKSADNKSYHKHGMAFDYLSSWKITEESSWFEKPYVFLETENSGLITINLFEGVQIKAIQAHAEEFSANAQAMSFVGSFDTKSMQEHRFESHIGLEERLLFTLTMKDLEPEPEPMVRYYFLIESNSADAEKLAALIILQTNTDDDLLESRAGLSQVLNSFQLGEPKP